MKIGKWATTPPTTTTAEATKANASAGVDERLTLECNCLQQRRSFVLSLSPPDDSWPPIAWRQTLHAEVGSRVLQVRSCLKR